MKKLIYFFTLFFAFSSQGARFANQFIEFEIPGTWRCALETTEWVCQNSDPEKKKDAIVILAAKVKGEQDSLDQYLDYLKKPKSFTTPDGQGLISKPYPSKYHEINGHTWVDSLHLNSEVSNYYTRYLATVKEDIAVLVTYSILQNKYKDYVPMFDDLVKTLVVFRKPGSINSKPESLFDQVNLSLDQEKNPYAQINKGSQKNQKGKMDTLVNVVLGALVLVIFGLYLWFRKRRKNKL